MRRIANRPDPGLLELKGKKLIFNQEPYSRAIPRRRKCVSCAVCSSGTGMLQVEGWLLDIEEGGGKVDSIPDEFYDVIVMAGHEL